MKYTVVGPRILVRVQKFSEKKDVKFEGSSFLMPDQMKNAETTSQTVGEVIQLGDTAYKRKDSGCDGTPWVKIGDMVHFSRYGAMRIGIKDSDEYELWVLMDKDVLVIESIGA